MALLKRCLQKTCIAKFEVNMHMHVYKSAYQVAYFVANILCIWVWINKLQRYVLSETANKCARHSKISDVLNMQRGICISLLGLDTNEYLFIFSNRGNFVCI